MAVAQLERCPNADPVDPYACYSQQDLWDALLARSNVPEPYKPNCQSPQNAEEADLCAQRRMAEAAEQLLTLTDRQVWLSIFGLAAILVTVMLSIRATRAAENQVRLSREAMVAEQRAWVVVEDIIVEKDFLATQTHGISLGISVKIINAGKSPAVNIATQVEMFASLDDEPTYLEKFCRRQRRLETRWGRSLIAGRSYNRAWVPGVSAEDVTAATQGRTSLLPVIIGCVTYQLAIDKSLHQTGFAYNLSRKNGGIFAMPVSLFQIGQIVPKDEVVVTVAPGGFAD